MGGQSLSTSRYDSISWPLILPNGSSRMESAGLFFLSTFRKLSFCLLVRVVLNWSSMNPFSNYSGGSQEDIWYI